MHNIHELEQRWFKYKVKLLLPYIIVITFSIILVITLIFITDSQYKYNSINSNDQDKIINKPIADVEPKKEIKQTIVKKSEEKIIVNEKDTQAAKLTLSPSLDFMKKLKTDSVNSYDNTDVYVSEKFIEEKPKTTKVIKNIKPKKVTSKKINISTRETQNDIQQVIKRFKKNNNPALSLFVAKKYYKLGDYEKAYNFALITNEINNEIEQSWIIFAKSLVKLKKKDLAIRTLTKYIRHSHSGNAKVLLDDIKSGKFK
ncbi:MAG: CDC27 family protein [Thiovulaceae bacterium]|nr:CDC27 family protein [Sulfurimonadaceae bacterium]